ncbi:MAG TPA: tRNA pseudouridine(55) synthase TruB [Alphaproteobacteria bacterium]|nr:tRNA pseudouridine(55) synthase TruB [Alphaproteobacteria bacterium]
MRRTGADVHGWLVLDKPAGISSAKAVAVARRALDANRAGHGGTLDPLASGVLPIAFGEATKTVAYAMAGTKTYRFTIRFGVATATDDAEGEIVARSDARPESAALAAALPRFTGAIAQVPPAYSAVKVGGERAYRLARKGAEVALKPRSVEIKTLTLLARPNPDTAELEVVCGKGVYIRSLARDLAQSVGTVGHIAALRRTRVGPFGEAQALALDKLQEFGHSPPSFERLLPVETVLDDIPALAVTEGEAERLRHGQALAALDTGPLGPRWHPKDWNPVEGAVLLATANGKPVALARLERGCVRPVRVLNL